MCQEYPDRRNNKREHHSHREQKFANGCTFKWLMLDFTGDFLTTGKDIVNVHGCVLSTWSGACYLTGAV